MADALITEPVPLELGADGVMRVLGTRVTLDTVWFAFSEGASAEEIAQSYPSLSLADAYQVIAYCLRHPSEIEKYMERRGETAQAVRLANESRWHPEGLRDRLLRRRQP